jgi:hypothetical protein
MSFNGYKNYQTWNVALWISNDEGLYQACETYKRSANPYESFKNAIREFNPSPIAFETPDGVSWNDSALDVETLNELIKEL